MPIINLRELWTNPDPRQLKELLHQAGEIVQQIRYERLRSELLQASNPEINTDRELLITRMQHFGFREPIVHALREVDRKLQIAGRPLDFNGCMDLARKIFEEIVEDAARRGAALKNRPVTRDDAKDNFRPWKELLIQVEALRGPEGVLFQALYDYLSNTGTHRLGSEPEQARIARNMVIECGLLLLGRLVALKTEIRSTGH